jgi:hypothetical protein
MSKPAFASADSTPGWPAEILPGAEVTWATSGWEQRPWRTAIARLSRDIALKPVLTGDMTSDCKTLRVSRSGTLTAATVVVDSEEVFTAVSVYSPWERPPADKAPIWADASAHRLLSDLTPLVSDQRRPVIVSGDWNILRGYGEHGDTYYRDRYQTVFDRAEALGLQFIGPEHPYGRQADPWPSELPPGSTCVPSYHHSRQTPETATRQLDFVFASRSFAHHVHAMALNDPSDWGPSDHCCVLIDIDVGS